MIICLATPLVRRRALFPTLNYEVNYEVRALLKDERMKNLRLRNLILANNNTSFPLNDHLQFMASLAVLMLRTTLSPMLQQRVSSNLTGKEVDFLLFFLALANFLRSLRRSLIPHSKAILSYSRGLAAFRVDQISSTPAFALEGIENFCTFFKLARKAASSSKTP